MKLVQNRDVNPIVALLANIFLPGLGDMILGQTNKGIMVFVCSLLGTCLCCVPGIVVNILSHIDVYWCATSLQKGEPLGENEYKQELLFKAVRLIDKNAIYRG